MITFLLIESNNTVELYNSIANNYDIKKYNYDIIVTDIYNIDDEIINTKNDNIFIINSICYFNTVMLEHLFEYVNKYDTDIYISKFIDRSSNLRLPIKNIYSEDTDIIEENNLDDFLNIADTDTISFVVKKSIILNNNIKYTNNNNFCKDIFSKIKSITYTKNIDFLFINYDYTNIIIDGFGISELFDNQIIEAFKNNNITHTSIVVNGNRFKDAINLIHNNNFINVGLHFNISSGYSKYDNSIMFTKDSINTLSYDFIEKELQSQLDILNKNHIFIAYISTDYNDSSLNSIISKYGIQYRKNNTHYIYKENEEYNVGLHCGYKNIVVNKKYICK